MGTTAKSAGSKREEPALSSAGASLGGAWQRGDAMSADLYVFTPEWLDLAACLGQVTTRRVVASGGAGGVQLLNVEGARRLLCAVEGPFAVEGDDVPPAVLRRQLVTRWLTQVQVPIGITSEMAEAQKIAQALAKLGEGLVYDPQSDNVTWPRGLKALRPIPARSTHNAKLTLEWAFARRLNGDDGAKVLAAFERLMPEAAPRRFGTFQPFQGRLDRDGPEAFTALWNERSMLFWAGTAPVTSGHVLLTRGRGSALDPVEREARRATIGGRKEQDIDIISLSFRGDVAGSPRWLGAITSLFKAVCVSTSPFMAAGYLDPDPDPHGRTFRLSARTWLGLPNEATWLNYIGEPYLAELHTALPTEAVGDGTIVHATGAPDERATASKALGWSEELIRRGDQLNDGLAARVIPDLTSATSTS